MNKIILENAKLINGKIVNILIENGIIKKISQTPIEEKTAHIVHLENDCIVSSGWIDAHTHCFEKFKIYADNCEDIGYKTGVTTVVDAGTAGSDNIAEFYESVKDCKTNVYAYLNISKTGIYAQNELADMNHIQEDLFADACEKYPDFIIGVKARMSKSVVGDSGDKPLYKAIEIANKVQLPLMVHIGTAPSNLEVVLTALRKNDIVTHIFNPKVNGIVKDNQIKPCVFEAIRKGIYLDLGHGTDSFSFDVLNIAQQNHIHVYSISSDIYNRNRINGPVYDLATTMSKLYNCGYSLEEVIDGVTSRPAHMLNLKNKGKIEEGFDGEFTIFKVVDQKKVLVDSTGKEKNVKKMIKPVAVVIKDEYICL